MRGAVARLAESSYENLHGRAARRGPAAVPAARRERRRGRADAPSGAAVASWISTTTRHWRPSSSGSRRPATDRARSSSVEVAHEALLREWPRFQDWLAEDAQGRELREHLTESAKRWDVAGRDPAELYRGARLSATIDWAAGRERELNELEREFLAESRSHADLEATRQRRQNRRLRGLLVGAAVLLVAAIVGGIVALQQRSSAQHQATVALGRQLGAEAVSQPRIDLSMLLARESLNLDRSPQTEGTLLATLLRSPAAIGTFALRNLGRPPAGGQGLARRALDRGDHELLRDEDLRHADAPAGAHDPARQRRLRLRAADRRPLRGVPVRRRFPRRFSSTRRRAARFEPSRSASSG